MVKTDKTINGSPKSNPEPGNTNPDLQKQAAEMRNRVHAAEGQVVLALSVVPRYRHQSIADLQNLVLEPLLRDRIAIATPIGGEGADAPDGGAAAGPGPAEEDGRGRRWRGGMNGRQAFRSEGVDAKSKPWLICVHNVAFAASALYAQ